ncbi:GNAT family N-acetyltransferase [Actinoplanes sp. ATCC 53533]|uniref:GNAT family N-acetyltransferase n=1 Tax=Actinoplanes sp. ATCC 53533 TaxID=1288362 RepID=UPI000F768E98|nr:GNAT family N-acetyltransferase [Actinoplanes sp. ATCC 53533]RSM58430.1 GNAT family N-acetyltransferase [Actinoplanes sp. ATCC 53533]
MSERLIDIVAVPDRPGVSRWQAVAPRGSVAGLASLRSTIPFGPDPPQPPAPELSLQVEPEWRRRGIGSRLLATVRAQTAEPRLVADVVAGSPGEAFCLRHGFRHTRSRRQDLLTYCDVHRAWLGELVDAEHPGYRLTHWTGDLPDAPRVEELLRGPSRPGDTVLTAAAADGVLAAYAMAVVGALSRPRARQYGPVVLPGHRGRRLGPWVNAALIQRLRELHPHVNEIEAAAEDDPDLLAARSHLGFRPLRRTRHYELTLRGT